MIEYKQIYYTFKLYFDNGTIFVVLISLVYIVVLMNVHNYCVNIGNLVFMHSYNNFKMFIFCL